MFDEEPETIECYLSGIKRELRLGFFAYLLGFKNRNSESQNHVKFLTDYFSDKNSGFASHIYQKILKIEEQGAKAILINVLSSLTLFEYCYDKEDSELETQSDLTNAEIEIKIMKVYLLINEKLSEDQNNVTESTKDIVDIDKLSAISLAMSFPYSGLANYNKHEKFICQLIKSVYLFEFLESNVNTQFLLSSFLDTFKKKEWKDYLLHITGLAVQVVNKKSEAHLDFTIEQNEDYEMTVDFFESLMLVEDEKIQDYDFRKTRSKPLYKVNEGVYRVIYDLFVLNLVHDGLYFKLSELNDKLGISEKAGRNFRSFFCDEFSEKVLLYRVLDEIYKNRFIKYTGEQIRAFGLDAEPDYYIRNGNKIFLFESKDILINAEIKTSYDYNLIIEEIKKKLYFTLNSSGRKKPKAILQLINNITRIKNNEFGFDSNFSAKSVTIYPILIVHNDMFNVVGINKIINYWYNNELDKIKGNGINTEKIKPLTIIDIDSLIFNQSLFSTKTVKLEKIIDDYHKFVKLNPNQRYRDIDHQDEVISAKTIPFSTYLANVAGSKNRLLIPSLLRTKGYSIFTD